MMKYRFIQFAALLERYRRIFSHYWGLRRELTPPALKEQEAEFLPAALALQNRPVSPAGLWVGRAIMALVAIALAWSYFGKLDVVVSGQGRIVAAGYAKTVASVDVAKVAALHVVEGQQVKAGDVLIELDTRATDSERDRATGDKELAQLQAARERALITALDAGAPPVLGLVPGVSAAQLTTARVHLAGQWNDYVAKKDRFQRAAKDFAQMLPLATQRAHDYAELLKTKDVSRDAWLEKEQARIQLEGQLADMKLQMDALTAETRKTALDAMNEATRVLQASAQDEKRAVAKVDQLKLLAPVDGTVQQLTVHTVGGVVPAAQSLMKIVPSAVAVEFEAMIENKDIGFVHEGQQVALKVDAFDYTKYGTLAARITQVSKDAQDGSEALAGASEARATGDRPRTPGPMMYAVKVVSPQTQMMVEGVNRPLGLGMSGTIEVKTGSRRVIEYLLSPLVQHVKESLGER